MPTEQVHHDHDDHDNHRHHDQYCWLSGGPFWRNGKALVAVPLFNGRETKRGQDVSCVISLVPTMTMTIQVQWYNTSPPYLSSASNTIQRQYVSKLFLSQKSQATAADIPPPVIFSERHTKQSTKLTRLI